MPSRLWRADEALRLWTHLSPSLVALGPAHAGSVWLPAPPPMVRESLLGGGPNGLTGRAALLWRRMLDSTCAHGNWSQV